MNHKVVNFTLFFVVPDPVIFQVIHDNFLSRLAKQEDSLLSCASDFLPITVFLSIRRIITCIHTHNVALVNPDGLTDRQSDS